jgi:hypothetical protein
MRTHLELFVHTVVETITQQVVDALKASIISGLAFRGLCEANCEDDGATLLDNLQPLLREADGASRNPSTSHGILLNSILILLAGVYFRFSSQ